MNLSEEQYELIEAYLNNELSDADRTQLEADLQTDAAWRQAVSDQRALRLGLQALAIQGGIERARAAYQASLPPTEATTAPLHPASGSTGWPHPGRPYPGWPWKRWVAAASVVVALGVGYWGYQSTQTPAPELAYGLILPADETDELLKAFPAESFSTAVRAQLLAALDFYRAGQYEQAVDRLRTLPDDRRTRYYKNYMLGLSKLAGNHPAEAIPLLQQALGSPSASLRQKADWMLALAYVKDHQPDKARPMLTRISTSPDNPFRQQAQQVLQKIE